MPFGFLKRSKAADDVAAAPAHAGGSRLVPGSRSRRFNVGTVEATELTNLIPIALAGTKTIPSGCGARGYAAICSCLDKHIVATLAQPSLDTIAHGANT